MLETTTNERVAKTTKVHLAMEAKEALRRIRESFADNPAGMSYFYDLFETVYCKGEPVDLGKKVVGVTCIQAPEELIYAAGAVPLRLCSGSHAYEQVGAEKTSAKTCSLVNATIGSMMINREEYQGTFDMLAIPATCDQKKKSIGVLKREGYNAYPLDIPSDKESEQGRHFWRATVAQFAIDLQKATKTKISKKSLAKSISTLNRARREMRRLFRFREESPSPILGKDLFLVANAYFFDQIDRWTDAVITLNEELEQRVKNGFSASNKNAPRILFAGTPPIFPNLKLPLLIEELGGGIVADESCSSARLSNDVVMFEEPNYFDMIPAIADRYLKPCVCPIFDSNDDRIRKMLEMVKAAKVDGVVYQSYSGCHLYTLEHHSVAEALQKENIQMLYVETDYGPEDSGQISTRIEAFLESIQTRKRRNVR